MKTIENLFFKKKMKLPAVSVVMLSSFLLLGCGASSETGTNVASTSSTVNKGVITGFGSVYVNGIKFETLNSKFDIDNKVETSQTNLRVGMVVTINGTVNADGKTGTASFIQYDSELKGPISSISDIDLTTKELVVLGRTITVTTDTVFDDDGSLTFATLATGVTIEISGLQTATGLTATHIEQQTKDNYDGELEILGAISSITGTALEDITFSVYGFNVKTDGATKLDGLVLADIKNGQFIEVKGTLDAAGTLLTATKIEGKKSGLGEDNVDEAEVEGVVMSFDATTNTFQVQGQTVDVSNATVFPASLVIADGLTLEVEGAIVDGVLIADKVKQKGNKIKIQSEITAIDTDNETISFTFNGTEISVRVNAQTKMEGLNGETIVLADLATGNIVKIKAFNDGTDVINAIELEVKNSTEAGIEAPIEAIDDVNGTLTVLGSVFDLSNATFEKSAISDQFYSQVEVGGIIELKDIDNDRVIDEVKIDD